MKILYITAEGFDTPNPNNQMAEVMIKEFLNQGNEVHLIQSHRKNIFPDIPPSIEGRRGFSSDTIVRKVVPKTNFIARYFNEVSYAFKSLKYWKKVKDVDVVYVQSNPTIIFTLLLLKLFKRYVPIVYSIYDVFPGHAYDIGVVKSRLVYNIMKAIQWPCYKLANAILVLSTDMKRIVVNLGAKEDDVYVVPAWYDISNTREIPDNENKFMKKYGITRDKFYIQFAGTIGYVFNYKTIIELALRLEKEKDIEIQIIGDGNVKEEFMAKAKELGLDNIKFYPLQPISIVPDVYSTGDICIIPLMKGVIGNGVPSKAAILMACKRVILSSLEQDSDFARMFAEKNMGVSVDINDIDKLAQSVLFLKNNPSVVQEMTENAYVYGKSNYSSTLSIKKIMNVFNLLVKNK